MRSPDCNHQNGPNFQQGVNGVRDCATRCGIIVDVIKVECTYTRCSYNYEKGKM
jgi:hypothetical protein